jgi:hypothetical protein
MFCDPNATFSSQAGALAGISTLEGYTEWMKHLFTPIPDGHYELKFFSADEADKIPHIMVGRRGLNLSTTVSAIGLRPTTAGAHFLLDAGYLDVDPHQSMI